VSELHLHLHKKKHSCICGADCPNQELSQETIKRQQETIGRLVEAINLLLEWTKTSRKLIVELSFENNIDNQSMADRINKSIQYAQDVMTAAEKELCHE